MRSPLLPRRLRNQRKVPVAQTRRSKHQRTVSQRLNRSQKSRSRAKANTLPRAKKEKSKHLSEAVKISPKEKARKGTMDFSFSDSAEDEALLAAKQASALEYEKQQS